MDRVKKWFQPEPEYEPIGERTTEDGGTQGTDEDPKDTFLWTEYCIFLLLGVSMLWAWNMFLAAGPYLQGRFKGNAWIYNNFQSVELVASTLANLGGMLILTKLQANASYPKRIVASLVMNMVIFVLLAISTRFFLDISAEGYFAFIVVTVFASSVATALCQNGIFAYVSGFGSPQYTQGIMTGQGVAGVLPCIAQIVLVLSVPGHRSLRSEGKQPAQETPSPAPPGPPPTPGRAAFAYFLTATGISAITLVAFFYLLRRQARKPKPTISESDPTEADDIDPLTHSKSVPLTTLFRKTFWLALAVFVTFAVTMVFPVYTQQITSVTSTSDAPQILWPSSFVPLAFLFWNAGDLIGRVIPAIPALRLTHRPRIVFVLSVLRVLFVPLYMLCNVHGKGAVVKSDFFYLVVVQLLFGLTNGYLGSTCMMGAADWVLPEEREAAGGFMGLCLVLGLTVGSFLSFAFTG